MTNKTTLAIITTIIAATLLGYLWHCQSIMFFHRDKNGVESHEQPDPEVLSRGLVAIVIVCGASFVWLIRRKRNSANLKIHLAPYCFLLTVGNCFLPNVLAKLADIMRETFDPAHAAAGRPMPGATVMALAMPYWFYIFTAISISSTAGLFIQKVSPTLLTHVLLCVCILQCVALLFFAVGMCIPFVPL